MTRQRRRARKIFISYSREGGQAHAVSLFQALVQVLGEKAVFLDVGHDAMEAGRSWRDSVQEALAECDTLLLVFDPGMTDRLSMPQNAVLFELETALENRLTVSSVRIGGAIVPPSSDLPESLINFSEWHSPEIHSDAAVADIERVVKELTGRVPGQVPLVDRWDLSIFGVLLTIGLVAWLSVGDSLNLRELLLWGTSLIMLFLLWMAIRRMISSSNRGRSSLSYRQASSWSVLLVIFSIGWGFAGKAVYPIPEFLDERGILVSRLKGDPADQYQGMLVDSLNGDPPNSLNPRVNPLPVRIGFSFLKNSVDSLNGHGKAHDWGVETGAQVVLWGEKVDPAKTDTEQLALNLTFVENDNLFRKYGAKTRGTLEATDLNGMDSDIEYLTTILVWFLDAYSFYREAESESDLKKVAEDFTAAINYLPQNPSRDSRDQKSLSEILTSLHFFRANTYRKLGLDQDAEADYRRAIDLAAGLAANALSRNTSYVAALSNLGYLLMKNNRLSEALEELGLADNACNREEKTERQRVCAYAWYNLADVLKRQRRFRDAMPYLKLSTEHIHKSAKGIEDRQLEAHGHQNLAYLLFRLAVSSEGIDKEKEIDKAFAEHRLAIGVFDLHELEVPEYFGVFESRVDIERRKWQAAIDILSNIEDLPDFMRVHLHALLAGAYYCLGEKKQYLENRVALLLTNAANDGPGITMEEGKAEIERIRRNCPTKT